MIFKPNHDDDDVPVICEGCWKFQSEKKMDNLIKCSACNSCIHPQCQGDFKHYFISN